MMPRPIEEQVVVLTGASSGIGRQSAIALGERGATVVLAARNVTALRETAREVEAAGGTALAAVTDVAEWSQVERLAADAVERFGRIDTWVNAAAISAYATVEQLDVEEFERIMQVNFMGYVYGVKAVLPHMVRQGEGGIINVGSVLSRRSVPLQAAYCASKHAIKGFNEALRTELRHEHPGISVTLVLPSSINTPLFHNARSKMGVLPQPIPPVYEPETVALAIAHAAEHPRAEIVVGGAGKFMTALQSLSPALVDRLMVRNGSYFKQQRADRPDDGLDNFDAPLDGPGSAHGDFAGETHPASPYTRLMELHPERKLLLGGAVAAGAVMLWRAVR